MQLYRCRKEVIGFFREVNVTVFRCRVASKLKNKNWKFYKWNNFTNIYIFFSREIKAIFCHILFFNLLYSFPNIYNIVHFRQFSQAGMKNPMCHTLLGFTFRFLLLWKMRGFFPCSVVCGESTSIIKAMFLLWG